MSKKKGNCYIIEMISSYGEKNKKIKKEKKREKGEKE